MGLPGLTGRSIGPADAYALGLLTHCIPAGAFRRDRALIDTWRALLDERQTDFGPRAARMPTSSPDASPRRAS
jgi:enoyl-CoA hydratase